MYLETPRGYMTGLIIKTILRVSSILSSIVLLKVSIHVIVASTEPWIRIIYFTVTLLGIPLIFIITNIVANQIKFGNRGRKK
jgi:hypothetical protein